MRPSALLPGAGAGLIVIALVVSGAAPTPAPAGAGNLPPIVFVSRAPVAGEPDAIPGLGPHHRAVVTGGRLLVRERDGRLRELLPRDAFHDVSDPSVSPGADRIAFAAVTGPAAAWRIWVVGTDGGGLRPVTAEPDDPGGPRTAGRDDRTVAGAPRSDDLDPCWIGDSSLVFASTRERRRSQYADVPATDLFVTCVTAVPGRGCVPERLTAERNGAEEPAMDWSTGEIVFARWWFNRHRAADTPSGLTTDPARAVAADTVNLWQAMALSPSDARPRLAAGDLASRRGTMGYQPAVREDGSVLAVYAVNLGLSPRPGGTGIHLLPRGFARARRLAGAIVPGRAGDAYGGAQGLAPPSACAPAALPDGRVLFSYAPGARGDFGLHVVGVDGSPPVRVLDLPGTLELDAAPIVRRRAPPRAPALGSEAYEDPAAFARARDGARSSAGAAGTFRFHDLDVFAEGPAGTPGHGAAPRTAGARLRFFATRERPGHAAGDSAILVREVAVGPGGEVDVPGLPAGTPMFEQLVGPDGRVLMTAHGPAHVAGSNAGVAGLVSRCVGCHLGHSTLPPAPAARRTGRADR